MDTDSTGGQDEPRSRKRAAASQGKSGLAAEKKRSQNRISQQCARERQSAYIRQMEFLVADLKTPDEGTTEQSKYDELANAHMKLAEEKKEVEDALFRLRQKLLSVGNLATSAADDPIFERLSNPISLHQTTSPKRDGKVPPQSKHGNSVSGPSRNPGAPDDRSAEFRMTSLPAQDHLSSSSMTQPPGDICSILPSPSAFLPTDLEISTDPMGSASYWVSPWTSPNLRFPFGLFDANAAPSSVPFPFDMAYLSHPQPPDTESMTVITNSSLFADQVKLAASHVLYRLTSASNSSYQGAGSQFTQDGVAAKLASVAVEVIGALAGLGPYIYGTNFSDYMESVLRWRLSNSVEDRLRIPIPFRPTPLQAATPHHPVVIDFINWPSIRDQMILYSSKLDLDAMSRDIVLNTVVELPRKRVSVNIHDLFFNYILPHKGSTRNDSTNSMLHNREWVYLKVPATSGHEVPLSTFSLTQEALASEMSHRMRLDDPNESPLLNSSNNEVVSGAFTTSNREARYQPETVVSNALAAFGIDEPCNWRLSKDFARKYPHIDCSLDVSRYDMVPSSSLSLEDVMGE